MSGSDERFEAVLGGDPPLSPEDPLGAFVRDVREAFPATPMLAEEAHLEAVTDAARQIAAVSRPPARRRESRVRIPRFRSLTAKVVAALVVVMTSFGGLAVAGALPGGIQDGVAKLVSAVGVDLPGGDDESEDATDDAVEVEAPEADEGDGLGKEATLVPQADTQGEDEQSGDKGEDEQAGDQGEDEQAGDQGDDTERADNQGEDTERADNQGEDERSGDQGDGGSDDEAGDGGGSGNSD